MTLYVSTARGDQIPAGFTSVMVGVTRLGDYSFATRDFCRLVADLAGRASRYETGIMGAERPPSYGEARLSEAIAGMAAGLTGLSEWTSMENALEDAGYAYERDVIEGSSKVGVLSDPGSGRLAVGKYGLDSWNASILSAHVALGGVAGWGGGTPSYASRAVDALKRAENGLFAHSRSYIEEMLDARKRLGA